MTGFDDAGVADDQHTPRAKLARKFAERFDLSRAENDARAGVEVEWRHGAEFFTTETRRHEEDRRSCRCPEMPSPAIQKITCSVPLCLRGSIRPASKPRRALWGVGKHVRGIG